MAHTAQVSRPQEYRERHTILQTTAEQRRKERTKDDVCFVYTYLVTTLDTFGMILFRMCEIMCPSLVFTFFYFGVL